MDNTDADIYGNFDKVTLECNFLDTEYAKRKFEVECEYEGFEIQNMHNIIKSVFDTDDGIAFVIFSDLIDYVEKIILQELPTPTFQNFINIYDKILSKYHLRLDSCLDISNKYCINAAELIFPVDMRDVITAIKKKENLPLFLGHRANSRREPIIHFRDSFYIRFTKQQNVKDVIDSVRKNMVLVQRKHGLDIAGNEKHFKALHKSEPHGSYHSTEKNMLYRATGILLYDVHLHVGIDDINAVLESFKDFYDIYKCEDSDVYESSDCIQCKKWAKCRNLKHKIYNEAMKSIACGKAVSGRSPHCRYLNAKKKFERIPLSFFALNEEGLRKLKSNHS